MIKLLLKSDINDCSDIISNVILKMNSSGINQWDEIYPARSDIENDINNNNAFGYIHNEKVSAYITLNELQSPEYAALAWGIEGRNLIVHRLSVSPDMQGKGIARKMMLFAEEYATAQKYDSIRLDAFTENPTAINLYLKLGYKEVGSVIFRKGKFLCYEKRIN
ncbi:MAG: GNAT family N-acetyltransferase [Dysgonomonas sp.]|uniref:GNAT family N-acetyltransferase n=1 Tax=Dysgonomonas sp. TaxID=1891233 RepID=UPI0039E2D082